MNHETALRHPVAVGATRYDFSGTWVNELGSTMDVAASDELLTGTFTSRVSGSGGPAKGSLTGWASGYLIAVTVRWDATAAITSWVGQFVREGTGEAIESLWQMTNATANPEDPTELWHSVLAGADRFTRQA